MAAESALIHDGHLYLPSTSAPIPIGSNEWLEWLKTARKFKFSHSQGYEVHPGSGIISFRDLTFTAFRAGKDKPYWNAQRRKQGDLRTRYLGRDEDLTYQSMLDVALLLDKGSTKDERKRQAPKSPSLESHNNEYETNHELVNKESHNRKYETETQPTSQATDEIAKLKDELERITQDRDALLIRLGNGKIQANEDAQQKISQLETRVTELDNANWELEKRYTQVNDLWHRSEQKRIELQAQLNECKTNTQPSALDLLSHYETNYETIKPALPKPPKELTRNWVEFWRFKTWLESR
jgi:hypothetical protein